MATAIEVGPLFNATTQFPGVPALVGAPASSLVLRLSGDVADFVGPIYQPTLSISSPAGPGAVVPSPGPGPVGR